MHINHYQTLPLVFLHFESTRGKNLFPVFPGTKYPVKIDHGDFFRHGIGGTDPGPYDGFPQDIVNGHTEVIQSMDVPGCERKRC